MATKKSAKNSRAKTAKKSSYKRSLTGGESGRLTAAASILFAACCIILVGIVQGNDNIKLLLIGFGAAFLVLGGVLVGMSTKPIKR